MVATQLLLLPTVCCYSQARVLCRVRNCTRCTPVTGGAGDAPSVGCGGPPGARRRPRQGRRRPPQAGAGGPPGGEPPPPPPPPPPPAPPRARHICQVLVGCLG